MVSQSKLISISHFQTLKLNKILLNLQFLLKKISWFFLSVRWNKIPNPENLGNFELLIDEDLAAQDESLTNNISVKNRASNRWK